MSNNSLTQISKQLIEKKLFIATAESCTGGLIAKLCTDLAGSSQWFDRSFITYSNEAKTDMLAVSSKTIEQYGAVSEQVVRQMAFGLLNKSKAQIGVAVTGIAGPSGGSKLKPVGTVWIGINYQGAIKAYLHQFDGDRQSVREQTADMCFIYLVEALK